MKNTIPKVSIIVPIHNAGSRLTDCLDTLINQTLRSIEIILVLDCPTDGSDHVARQYAQNDDRIIILENSKNLHIGNSRNRGLEIARGEYIGFSDHDDSRELNMYEELYNLAQSTNSDLVLGVSVSVGEQNEIVHFPSGLGNSYIREYALVDLIRGGDDVTLTPIATNIHSNIYKAELLQTNNITFVDTFSYSPEDRIFQIMCIFYAKNIRICNSHLYYHFIHNRSAGHSLHYVSCYSRANGKMKVYDFLKLVNCYEKYKPYFLISTKKEFTNCVIGDLYSTKNIFQLFKTLKHLKSFPFCKTAFQTADYSLAKYSFGGKIFRKVISLLIRL